MMKLFRETRRCWKEKRGIREVREKGTQKASGS